MKTSRLPRVGEKRSRQDEDARDPSNVPVPGFPLFSLFLSYAAEVMLTVFFYQFTTMHILDW